MVVARDPLGIKPLSYAVEGPLFAAASESVALMNVGFATGEHQVGAAGPRDHHQRRTNEDRAASLPARGAPTVSSSGSISPTSPAPSTAAACTWPARRWARNWPGSKRVPIDARHDRRPGAGHEQGRGRRHGLRLEGPLRGRADPQPLHRPDVHRRERRPQAQGRDRSTPRSAKCSRASGCSWSRTRSSARPR